MKTYQVGYQIMYVEGGIENLTGWTSFLKSGKKKILDFFFLVREFRVHFYSTEREFS